MYEKRIEAGIIWLDKKYTREEWLPSINLDTLNMNSLEDCIIGQIAGDYDHVFDWKNHIEQFTAVQLGFDLLGTEMDRKYPDDPTECYNVLTAEWKAAITALKEPASV